MVRTIIANRDENARTAHDGAAETDRGQLPERVQSHDLQARPIYHHPRESIEAHLSIVVAAMAVSHYIEHQTGWASRNSYAPARRYRTVTIKAGNQTLTAADPLPDDLRAALIKIRADSVH